MAADLDTLIERKLRSIDKPIKTNELVESLAREDFPTASAVYKRLLALAPRCPSASKDTTHAFVRYGRTCYPWVFRRLLDGEALQQVVPDAPLPGAVGVPLARQIAHEVVALLKAGGYTLATIGPETAEPEACILCSTMGQGYVNGICPTCSEQEV